MFGVMGISAAFAQAAGAKKQQGGNYFLGTTTDADPQIKLSCTGEITIRSIKNGEEIVDKYNNLAYPTLVSIRSDADSEIEIHGDCKTILLNSNLEGSEFGSTGWYDLQISISTLEVLDFSNCQQITEVNLSGCVELEEISCNYCSNLTDLDLTESIALQNIYCSYCTELGEIILGNAEQLIKIVANDTKISELNLTDCAALFNLLINNCAELTDLDVSTNTALASLGISNCPALTTIKYAAGNSDVSTAIADAITAATAADGTVYTDSAGAYYSTIETAATTKGWTIEQIAA